MEEDEYGGYKLNIIAELENLRINLSIDVSSGDIITPRKIEYGYISILDEEKIDIMAYNKETIIAEKFETIIMRNVLNSRMKDYYDIYCLFEKEYDLDENILKKAIKNTFKKRECIEYLEHEKLEKIYKDIFNSEFLKTLWSDYSIKHEYSKNVKFKDVCDSINKIIKLI